MFIRLTISHFGVFLPPSDCFKGSVCMTDSSIVHWLPRGLTCVKSESRAMLGRTTTVGISCSLS